MLQIRLHGRGGQGVVTAAEMLTLAAFYEGHHAQAFPSFGSERTGAPVVAYARIDNQEIRTHEPIQQPNVVIVQDKTLLASVDVFAGLDADGFAIINSKDAPEVVVPELILDEERHAGTHQSQEASCVAGGIKRQIADDVGSLVVLAHLIA